GSAWALPPSRWCSSGSAASWASCWAPAGCAPDAAGAECREGYGRKRLRSRHRPRQDPPPPGLLGQLDATRERLLLPVPVADPGRDAEPAARPVAEQRKAVRCSITRREVGAVLRGWLHL